MKAVLIRFIIFFPSSFLFISFITLSLILIILYRNQTNFQLLTPHSKLLTLNGFLNLILVAVLRTAAYQVAYESKQEELRSYNHHCQ